MTAEVDEKKCKGVECQKCINICPVGAISIDLKTKKAKIDPDVCIGCGSCEFVCPTKAIKMK